MGVNTFYTKEGGKIMFTIPNMLMKNIQDKLINHIKGRLKESAESSDTFDCFRYYTVKGDGLLYYSEYVPKFLLNGNNPGDPIILDGIHISVNDIEKVGSPVIRA